MNSHAAFHMFATVKHHNTALLFIDYMKTQSFHVEMQKHNNDFMLFCGLDELEQVCVFFEQFIQNPYSTMYQLVDFNASSYVFSDAGSDRDNPLNKVTLSRFSRLKERLFPPAGMFTLGIFIVCWSIFIVASTGFANELFLLLKFYSQLSFTNVLLEPYRFITPAVFHFSVIHIVFNTLWWWQFGGAIEQRMGTVSLFNVFWISAVISNTGQYLATSSNFGGLSGVVYALVGYVWYLGYVKHKSGLVLSHSIMLLLLCWLILGFFDWLPIDMANIAHLLGLITGFVMAVIKNHYDKQSLKKSSKYTEKPY